MLMLLTSPEVIGAGIVGVIVGVLTGLITWCKGKDERNSR